MVVSLKSLSAGILTAFRPWKRIECKLPCGGRFMNDAVSVGPGAGPFRLLFSRRPGNLIGFLICAGLIAFAYYLRFARGLEPCPLCMIQRVVFAAMGIVFLAAAIHHPRRIGARI